MSLNINKNTAPVRALGKMLLQNLQLVVGKRYESESERKRRNKPLFSVVMDEFAPFGYRNFAQILNTARGTNTAFLFSMQSLPQFLQVGKGSSRMFRPRRERRCCCKRATRRRPSTSSRHRRRSRFRSGRSSCGGTISWASSDSRRALGATEREQLEFRALDHHIKNLGKGKMEILMTDPVQGTLHGRLHVRPPADVRVPCCEPACSRS